MNYELRDRQAITTVYTPLCTLRKRKSSFNFTYISAQFPPGKNSTEKKIRKRCKQIYN